MTDKQGTFGERLANLLLDKKMTQTDLARLVFNEPGVDNRGYDIWKGKDRISSYVNDRQLPSPRNYRKILEALEVTPEQLPRGERISIRAPGRAGPHSEQPPMEITLLAGTGGNLARLRINSLITVESALKIMQIVNDDRERRRALKKEVSEEAPSLSTSDEPRRISNASLALMKAGTRALPPDEDDE